MSTILVIDDDRELRHVLSLALQRAGFNTVEAGDGAEGLKILERVSIDLVVTDVLMPNTDGIEIIRAIRHHYAQTAVIAMSGGGVVEAGDCLALAAKLGADHVLQKPFELVQLEELARKLTSQAGHSALHE